jgi:hypothetical protein
MVGVDSSRKVSRADDAQACVALSVEGPSLVNKERPRKSVKDCDVTGQGSLPTQYCIWMMEHLDQ